MTIGTAVDGRDVEEDDEEGEQTARCEQTHPDPNDLASPIELVEVYEGQEREGEEEAEDEAEQVRVVVDVREETHREEGEQEAELFEERATRMPQDLPVLNELRKQTGDDAELGASRTSLKSKMFYSLKQFFNKTTNVKQRTINSI